MHSYFDAWFTFQKKSLKAREMKNFEKAFESSEIDSDVLSGEEELPSNEPVADNMVGP